MRKFRELNVITSIKKNCIMKQRILYITPHLSTGGLPQYLLAKIRATIEKYTIFVVEYSYLGSYDVQRKQIKEIVGEKMFRTLSGDKQKELKKILDEYRPDIVNFEELAETMLSSSDMKEIYAPTRDYVIIENTHSSLSNPSQKTYVPDKFIFASEYTKMKFDSLNVPTEVWEYPVFMKKRPDRTTALKELGLDPAKKHVLNVGLFTPGKNQEEVIKISKLFADVMFHFVGNQAPNFESYWKPLMNDLPTNCNILGEKDNVEEYMLACDVFYFSSLFELNPIVIKEALSCQMTVLMRNLHTYMNKYDGVKNVKYLSDNLESNENLLKKTLAEFDFTDIHNSTLSFDDIRKISNNSISKYEQFHFSFHEGAKVEIKGNTDKQYNVKFYDDDNLEYHTNIGAGYFATTNKKYYVAWKIQIWDDNILMKEEKLILEDKRVLINIQSKSLGDTLAWVPQAVKFAKLHKCHLMLRTYFNDLFDYDDIEFISPGVSVGAYATYSIGYFLGENKKQFTPVDPRRSTLQKVASDILGMKYEEIRPILKKTDNPEPQPKYVCIATASTAKAKLWNRENGWQDIIDYLRYKGLVVKIIQQEPSNFEGVIDLTGNHPIEERIKELIGCEFFIGLGSGLSWLAWATYTPVIMISGFSKPFAEFENNRIINENVCNGCWNDTSHTFDKGNWNWCPRHENTNRQFECTKSIGALRVMIEIDKLLT